MIIDVIKKWLFGRGFWFDVMDNTFWTDVNPDRWGVYIRIRDGRVNVYAPGRSVGSFYFGDPDLFAKLEELLK